MQNPCLPTKPPPSPPLPKACRDTEYVKRRFACMQDAVGELGNTPIHLAAASGHTPVVKLLLRQGANVVCCRQCFAFTLNSSTCAKLFVVDPGAAHAVAHVFFKGGVCNTKCGQILSNINKAPVLFEVHILPVPATMCKLACTSASLVQVLMLSHTSGWLDCSIKLLTQQHRSCSCHMPKAAPTAFLVLHGYQCKSCRPESACACYHAFVISLLLRVCSKKNRRTLLLLCLPGCPLVPTCFAWLACLLACSWLACKQYATHCPLNHSSLAAAHGRLAAMSMATHLA